MNIKVFTLFGLLIMVTACMTIEPVEQNKVQPVGEAVSSNENIELKHGQALEEHRKGLPAYWH